MKTASDNGERRQYQSVLRKAQAAETRERILAAGSALAHEATSWDWRDITVRTVAARAGVSERTVYRHFDTERQFRDALIRQLEREAGVSYEAIDLDNLTDASSRLFASLPSFAATPTAPYETFSGPDSRRPESLLRAVSELTTTWSPRDRRMAAAILDLIWTPPAYERLITGWGFDTAGATRAVAWAIDVLVKAIRDDVRPAVGERS